MSSRSVATLTSPPLGGDLVFPADCLTGTLGEMSIAVTEGTELSPEFVFASCVTILGAMTCRGWARVRARFFETTRMYTVLLGEPGRAKKSASMKAAKRLMEGISMPQNELDGSSLHYQFGVGSGEGVATVLGAHPNTVLMYDELRLLMDKANIQGASILSVISKLYHERDYENTVRAREQSVKLENVDLSLIGCATPDTYQSMFSAEAINIGLPTRLFVVTASPRQPCPLGVPEPTEKIEKLRNKLERQLSRLPQQYAFSKDGEAGWNDWYLTRRPNDSSRLDTLGMRMLPLFALTMDKECIDAEVVETVTRILDYENQVRTVYAPVDASTPVAKLELKIMRTLTNKGARSIRDLRRDINADRDGIGNFHKALENLKRGNLARMLADEKWAVVETSSMMTTP